MSTLPSDPRADLSGDLATDATLAAELVREAGSLARRLRVDGLAVQSKGSVSDVVTAADRAAERLIAERLVAVRPEDGLLGEEGSTRESVSGRTWVIDPIDGTYNFAQGLAWWCSALALTGAEDVQLGAVYHPSADLLYLGGPGVPPTCDGVRLAPIADRPLDRSCMVTYLHPPLYAGEIGAAFARLVAGAATVRMLGSGTLDAMAIARGEVHVSCQHSVPPWDWLPGAAIVRGVGGAARRVRAAGVEWSVAGVPTAVAQACAALDDAGR